MNNSISKCEVAIIGASPSGLSCRYHLEQLGYQDIAVLGPTPLQAIAPPFAFYGPGMLDNYNRIHHNFGREAADQYWRFSCEAANFVHGLESGKQGFERWRVATAPGEAKEIEQAVEGLKEAGFAASIEGMRPQVQVDAGPAGLLTGGPFTCGTTAPIPEVLALRRSENGFLLETKDASTYLAQVVVLACQLEVLRFIPHWQDVLIPYADQYQWAHPSHKLEKAPFFASGFHGYHYAVWDGRTFFWGGGRYLRHHAGIGQDVPDYQTRIARHSSDYWKGVLNLTDLPDPDGHRAFIDIRPCDETPIVGPMFGEPGLFITTGFMGNGIHFDLYSGKLLAEFIVTGRKPDTLPSRFLPERLRSLAT